MNWAYALFLIGLGGFGIVYLVWPENQVLAPYGYTATSLGVLLCSVSFLQSARAWKKHDWQRASGQGMAIGFAVWFFAGVTEAIEPYLNQPAYGSMADLLWIAGYLPMFVGLYPAFQNAYTPGRNKARIVLLSVAVGYVAIFYLYLIPHLVDPARPIPEKILDVIYASFNFLLLGILMSIYRHFGAAQHPVKGVFRLMSLATGIMVVSDLMLGYYTERDSYIFQLLDIPYFLLYFLYFHSGQEFARAARLDPAAAAREVA